MSDSGSPRPSRISRRDRSADQQYWQLWRQGQRPDLRAFLAARPTLSAVEAAAVIAIDQYERWLGGERVRAEDYLPLLPAGPDLDQAGCDIVYGEYLLCEQMGEAPSLEAFQHRFPAQAALLARQVELHHALAGHSSSSAFPPPAPTLHADGPGPRNDRTAPPVARPDIPGYEVLEELGRGGMGVVYKARQVSLDRIVALKVMRVRPGDDPGSLERMDREAKVTARLAHPHIVTVFDAGRAGEWFYFAMEFVAGIDLHRLVEQSGPLPAAQACAYMRQAALGLEHAHEHGLVHRDIKPSNLIVTTPAGGAARSLLKVLDLGLARQPDTVRPGAAVTQVGTFLGTPDFMAPEQASDPHAADIRSDLYSLGCTFYYVLTGRAPFGGVTPLAKLMQHQLHDPPPLPASLPAGLVALVGRLMAKNPNDRFQTPAELVAALDRFLATIGPPLPTLGGQGPASSFLDRSLVPPPPPGLRLVRRLAGPADWVKCVAFSPDGNWLAAGSLDRTFRVWDSSSGAELARREAHGDGLLCLAFAPVGRRLATGGQDRTLVLWDLDEGPARARPRWRAAGHTDNINALAFLPDGSRLLSGSHDGTLRLWEAATGRELRAWHAHAGAVWSVAVSPDGRHALSGGQDRTIRWWDVERGEGLADWPEQARAVSCVGLSPDGRQVLSGGMDGVVRVWDLAGRREVRALEGHASRITSAAFSPDGRLVLSGSRDQTVRLFDVAAGLELGSPGEHGYWVTAVAWQPAGVLAASGSGDRTVCLWQVQPTGSWSRREGMDLG